MKYIENWPNKNLTCHFCGTDKSVKYEVEIKDADGKIHSVPCCNMCALLYIINQ